MVWVVPIPRLAPIIIVLKHPFKTLNIGLSDIPCELLDLTLSNNMEFLPIVPLLPPLLCQFDLILIRLDHFLALLPQLFVDDILQFLGC